MIESSLAMLKQLHYQQAMQTGCTSIITFALSQLADLRTRAEFAAKSS